MEAVLLTELSDIEIIDAYCNTGNQRAATAFVRKYQKFVFATVLRYLNNFDDAEDVTQEVFIKALNNLDKFRKESNIKTWLYRISVNQSINFKRKKSIFSVFKRQSIDSVREMSNNSPNPLQMLEGRELELKFLSSLARLPEKQRETFALKYFEGLTYDEISSVLGTSVGGLKANYFQAVKKLSEFLNKDN